MARGGFGDQESGRATESAATPEAVKNVLDAVKGLGFEDKELKLVDNGMGTFFFNQKDLYVQATPWGKARLSKITLAGKDVGIFIEGKGPKNASTVGLHFAEFKERIADGKIKKITREQYLED